MLYKMNSFSESLDLLICGTDCSNLSNLLLIGSRLAPSAVQHTSLNILIAQQWNDYSSAYIDGMSKIVQHLENIMYHPHSL